jgi:tetratricopeptide (TPR) repeat protein
MRITVDLSVDLAARARTVLDLGDDLASVAATFARTDLTDADAQEAVGVLRHRLSGCHDLLNRVEILLTRLEHVTSILRFTDQGWPEVRRQLSERGVDDVRAGVAAWLEYWYEAAAGMRHDALDRLLADVPLDPSVGLVHQRMQAATTTLRQLTSVPRTDRQAYFILQPVLEAGFHGIDVGTGRIPSDETRRRLWSLLTRLAVRHDVLDDAERLLAAAEADEDDDEDEDEAAYAILLVLRARLADRRGDRDRAAVLLVDARRIEPANLDLLVESIGQANAKGDVTAALEAGRTAADSLRSLADVENDLRPVIDVPPEMWLAVTARALREFDGATAQLAVDRARQRAAFDQRGLRALIAEADAKSATDPGKVCQAWIEAGDEYAAAEQFKLAAECYQRAMAVEGADEVSRTSAAGKWADMVVVLSWPLPLHVTAPDLRRALTALRTGRQLADASGDTYWWLMVEASLHGLLADAADESWIGHKGQALLAAARAAALHPDTAACWDTLALAADELDLTRFMMACSTFTLTLTPTSRQYVTTHVQALANLGRMQEALDALGDAADDWSDCVRGFISVHEGDLTGGIRLLRGATINPQWAWAWSSLVYALFLSGRRGEALERSAWFSRQLADRHKENVGLQAAAFDAFIRGDADQAVAFARQVAAREEREDHPVDALGRALVLAGDMRSGTQILAKSLQTTFGVVDLIRWKSLDRPVLDILLGERGVPVTALHQLDELADVRMADLRSYGASDDIQALRTHFGPAIPAGAPLLCAALAAVAEERYDLLDAALDKLDGEPGLAAEVASVRDFARRRTERAARAEVAAGIARAAAGGDDSAALAGLRKLLDEVPYETDDLLKEVEDGTGEPVLRLLRSLGEDESYQDRARVTLSWLGGFPPPSPPDEPADFLRLRLPESWFTGVADPVNDHALFRREIPEARAVQPDVPTIRVKADASLEPDGYRLETPDGDLLASGRIKRGLRYAPGSEWTLLPASVTRGGRLDEESGWWAGPAADLEAGEPLTALLTMSPTEAVMRRVRDALVSRRTV